MHLRHLEDYVVELASKNIDSTAEFVSIDDVVSRLMQIIVIEERLIPDFVIDGDTLSHFEDDFFGIDEYSANLPKNENDGGNMKILSWFCGTLVIGAICFLIGFFVAPA